MLRRSLTLALLAVLAAPAAALALSPPVSRPFTPQLRQAGWIVSWPSQGTLAKLDAGDTVKVGVRPRAKRAPARGKVVRVALLRVKDGGGQQVVAQRRLRTGVFRAQIPAAAGARYVLAISAAGRTHRTPFTPLPEATTPVTPPVAPQPPQPPADPCVVGDPARSAAATLTLDRTALRNGETFTATIANTGQDCLSAGYPYWFERPVAGGWEQVPSDEAFILPAFYVRPGATWASLARVLDVTAMPPGRYRIVKSVIGESRHWPDGQITISAEFDVVAP